MSSLIPEKGDETRIRAGQIRLRERWNRIDPRALSEALSLSVSRAVSQHAPDLGPLLAARLRRSVMEGFNAEVRNRARRMLGMSKSGFIREMERSRDRLLEECDEARGELLRLRAGVARVKTETPPPKKHEPDLDRRLDAEMEKELHRVFGDFARTAEHKQPGLEKAVIALVLSHARRQRWTFLKERLPAHRDRIDLLERRIEKLKLALERTEKALQELVRTKLVDEAGVASIYREVQGLSTRAPDFEKKKEMLREIFEANVELQGVDAA